MLAGDVLSLAADGAVQRRHVGEVAAALRPRAGGGAVIAVERGFVLEAPRGGLSALPPLWDDRGIRMNDGACDPQGRFLCGSMAYDQRPGAGAVYRLDPDGAVEVVMRDVTISNGLDWSPGGDLAYYADTATVELPVTDVTACTFGGPGLATLFITTTRENLAEGEQPEAGSVFACTPGVAGLPVRTF